MRKSKAFSLQNLFPSDTRPFATSWILPPLFLGLLRLLFFTYCLATQLTNWIYDGVHSTAYLIGQEFSYFTILTYFGLLFWSLVAGVHTLVYASKGHSWLENWPRTLQALHSFFYTTIVTLPFLVTIVYWGVLYKGPWFPVVFNAWSNISRHALNSLFALFELTIPATNAPPLLHLVGLVVLLLLYLSLAYLTRATEGFYVYDFLDPSKGKGRVAAYCFGIAAAIIIIFFLVKGLIWLRRKYTGDGKLSKNDMRGHLPVVEEYEMSRDIEASK